MFEKIKSIKKKYHSDLINYVKTLIPRIEQELDQFKPLELEVYLNEEDEDSVCIIISPSDNYYIPLLENEDPTIIIIDIIDNTINFYSEYNDEELVFVRNRPNVINPNSNVLKMYKLMKEVYKFLYTKYILRRK